MDASDHQPPPAVIELSGADIPARLAPETTAVAGVNWTVRPGDFWVIAGLQGSGKTDLLFAMAGLNRPRQGSCRLFGHEVGTASAEDELADRLRIGLLFGEGGRLFADLTVWENVALPLRYHHPADEAATEERVRALLQGMELEAMATRFPSGLNPAWQQRVALARALALRPEVLLVDNPLAGLDPRHARWWIQCLDQLAAGHPLLAGHSLTLVVTVDDLRPWLGAGRRYALLTETQLRFLENPAAPATAETQPILHELLSSNPHPT